MQAKDYVTLTIAVIGCVIGIAGFCISIFNTIKAHRKDKVSLKTSMSFTLNHLQKTAISVRVVNHSVFPVTISVINFGDDEHRISDSNLFNLNQLPKRLEARTAATFQHSADFHTLPPFKTADALIVETECGTVVKDRKSLKEIQRVVCK